MKRRTLTLGSNIASLCWIYLIEDTGQPGLDHDQLNFPSSWQRLFSCRNISWTDLFLSFPTCSVSVIVLHLKIFYFLSSSLNISNTPKLYKLPRDDHYRCEHIETIWGASCWCSHRRAAAAACRRNDMIIMIILLKSLSPPPLKLSPSPSPQKQNLYYISKVSRFSPANWIYWW